LANDENLSANIDISVGIDSASVEQAKRDIESIGAAADAVSKKVEKIGKARRPSKDSQMLNNESLAQIEKVNKFASAILRDLGTDTGAYYQKLKKLGYELAVDRKSGQASIRPIQTAPYDRSRRAERENRYGGDRYIGIDQLAAGGPDREALKQGILASLRKMGFTGIKDYIVGGIETAAELLSSETQNVEGMNGSYGAVSKDLNDEMHRIEADFINSESKKIAKLAGIVFAPDAMSASGNAQDFQIDPNIMDILKNSSTVNVANGGEEIKKALQDFIPGKDGTPIISPQTFLVAAQDALGNMTDAKGRAHIADNLRKRIEDEIQQELDFTFAELTYVINETFTNYDYNNEAKYEKEKENRLKRKLEAEAKKQEQARAVMLMSNPAMPGGGISPFSNETSLYQLDKKELLIQNIKKQIGVKDNSEFENKFEDLISDYIEQVFRTIADTAAQAGENVIDDYKSNYGELKIGDATGAIDNMQEYVDRKIIEVIAKLEEKYGLRQGAFATAARYILPEEYNPIINTAWQTNVPGLPQSRPVTIPKPGESLWSEGDIPIAALYQILDEIKTEQKLAEAELKAAKAELKAAELAAQEAELAAEAAFNDRAAAAAADAQHRRDTQGYHSTFNPFDDNYSGNVDEERDGVEPVVSAIVNSTAEALKSVKNNPEFQNFKNIIGEELFGQIFDFMIQSAQENAGRVSVGWDTEHTPALAGKAGTILESSMVLKNALGQYLDLQTFMHRPAYLAEGGMGVAGMNQAMYAGKDNTAAIGNISQFNKRANLLGIPESELGNLKNIQQNNAELEQKISVLLALVNFFDSLNVPVSGQNVMNADFNQVQNTVGYLQSQGSHIRATGGLSNIVDNAGILKSMQGSAEVTDPGVIFAKENKGNLGQSKLLKQLFEDFKDATAPYAKMVEFTKNGFTIKIDGKELPAHTAQADAIASIIVTEVMRQVSPVFSGLMDAPGYKWLPAGSVYSSETMPYADPKKSKGKTDKPAFDMKQRSLDAQVVLAEARAADQQDSPAGQAALAEARLSHVVELYKAIQSVITGTYEDAEKTNAGIKGMLKTLFAETQKRADVLSSQSVRTVRETAELEKANQLLELRKTLLEKSATAEGSILKSTKTLKQISSLLVDDYTAGLAKIEASEKARSKESKTIEKNHETLSDTLGRPTVPVNISTVAYGPDGARDLPFATTRVPNLLNQQAGPVFSKQIEAQMKEYVAAEKRVESGNKNMINTWVTARYALYDVGNAFQNVSQRMFMLARQIFNITDAYRSFESAFMPVERAMGLLSDETQGMLDQFIKLSETIPLTVEELSRIATLGAQMGIGASGIVKFTETVSQFSAITGMSADTIAEKFGRISQLTKLESDQMSNLGSAIAYAGVNAVATEPEILSLAEAIAAVSQRVGILPAEVIGLSTSLASLGVPAEQARGVFTRLFGKIDRAVGDGGPTLQKFAKIAGTSADEFKKKWGEAGQSYDLIRGILDGVNNSGKDLTKVFDTLGITETREVNTLTRLAKNLDVVDSSMSDATKAFASNIFLQQAFAKNAETVDSKIKLFQNSIQSFGAEIGKNLSGQFKAVLETLTGLMNGLKVLANDPVMQLLAGATSGLAAFGGVAAGMVAIMSKITAQIYAFRVAMINTANDPTAVTGITKQIKALLNYKTELVEMRDSLQSPNASARGVITPVSYPMGVFDKDRGSYLQKQDQIYRATGKELQQQLDAVAVSEGRLNSVRKFSNITSSEQLMFARMEADQINQLVRIRAFEIQALDAEVAKKIQSGALSAEAGAVIMNEARSREINYTMINGEIRGISLLTALEADGIAVSGAVTAAQQAEAAARLKTADAIAAQTRAGAVSGTGALGGFGATLMGIAGWAGLALGVATAIWGIYDAIQATNEEAKNWKLDESGGGIASLRDAIAKDTVEFYKSGKAIGTAKIKYDEYTATLNKSAEVIQDATGTTLEMNSKTASLTSQVKTQTLALGENAQAWIANSLASNPKVKSLFDQNPNLISDLKKQGIVFADVVKNLLNPEIKNPLKSVDNSIKDFKIKMGLFKAQNSELRASSAGGTVTFYDSWKDKKSADEYSKMMKQLKTFEKTKALLESLKGTIGSAMSQSAFQKVVNEILGITDPLDDVNDALARTVKSTRSWASEVAGIFGEAFQNRFGREQALDNINKQWLDMRKNVDDARKAIDETRRSMDSINADKTTLETQLEVAIRYGDTVREQKIRAELAQKTAELGNLQTQLQEQNKVINKSLVGDNANAIDNRAQILSMTQAYDPYIEQILATSKNADEASKKIAVLKQEFTDNALALGFNSEELTKYSKHFDDMLTIVTLTPRTVTLELVKDPALNAIRSFVDAANGSLSKIKNAITIDVKTTGKGSGILAQSLSASDSTLADGSFVIKAASVGKYGLDFMNSLNQQRVGYVPAASQMLGTGSGADSQVVYLSPEDRALLRSALDRPVNLYTENVKIAQSANAGNVILAQRGTN